MLGFTQNYSVPYIENFPVQSDLLNVTNLIYETGVKLSMVQ